MTTDGRWTWVDGVRCAAARWVLAALVASASAAAQLRAQAAPARADSAPLLVISTPVRVTDAGPGLSGRALRSILAGPHVVLRGDSARALLLRRDTTFSTSVVVLGGDVVVAAHVRGDLVAIGGDVYVRPGARVGGRAIAFGGAVYPSALGIVTGGLYLYRDHTFVPTQTPSEIRLAYRDLERYEVPVVAWPLYGLQVPEYTRVDGLAIGVGPTITIAEGGTVLVPTVTYRSHLGALDPRIEGTVRLDRRTHLLADVGRATFSNDRWIRGNIINSVTTLVGGVDTRNYFRADRADMRVERSWEGVSTTLVPFVGARAERAWSTGPDSTTTSRPWTLLTPKEREDGVLRDNPPVVRGNITSALGGAHLEWESPQRVTFAADALLEHAFAGPADAYDGFTQVTAHGELAFPTFGTQSFQLTAHTVLTGGDAPPQRWAYLGGNGTLLTLELLEMGGDQLAYVDSRYNIPIDRIRIPLAGPPVLTLRHAMGSAGVGHLPRLVQNVGVRVTVAVIRFDLTVDPASHRTRTDFSFAMPFGF